MPHNFAAGPAALPRSLLQQAQAALLDWNGTGLSLLELPFTGPEYREIAQHTEATLRELLDLPPTFRILFLQGGAYGHAALVAMNLMGHSSSACYAVTGHWASRAAAEVARYGSITSAFPLSDTPLAHIPAWGEWTLPEESAYLHITSNETADGLQFHWTPECGDVPLVADMTSDLLTRPIDWERYRLVYASAQKNLGPSGLTVVIIHENLFNRGLPQLPAVFDYTLQSERNSRVNTPPLFAVYLAGLMFDWVRDNGGLATMAERSRARSWMFYDYCDRSGFYHCPIDPTSRSHVNLRIHLPSEALEEEFIQKATSVGLLNLRGHSAVGGIRVSLYNAVSDAAVEALLDFMEHFARRQRRPSKMKRGLV